jgi:hypothetical protein
MREFAFFQKFSLRRDRLAGILRAVAANPYASSIEIGTEMGVNPYMVEGFEGWLYKTGLATKTGRQYVLSSFGIQASTYDPTLTDPGTLWLLHFYLTTHHAERAEVWYRFFNEYASPYQTFTRDEWLSAITRMIADVPKNKAGLVKDPTELLNTYTRPEALGDLGLIQKIGKDSYGLGGTNPPLLVAAFMLFDTWERRFSHADTVRLSQICQESEFIGKVCVADRERVHTILNQLQSLGLLVLADTQHEPVTRRFREPLNDLLEQYYGQR